MPASPIIHTAIQPFPQWQASKPKYRGDYGWLEAHQPIWTIHDRHHVSALNCKILLPKFNTWKQVLLDRETSGFCILAEKIAKTFGDTEKKP